MANIKSILWCSIQVIKEFDGRHYLIRFYLKFIFIFRTHNSKSNYKNMKWILNILLKYNNINFKILLVYKKDKLYKTIDIT